MKNQKINKRGENLMIINSYRPFSIIITLFAFIVLWGCATPLKTASDVQSGCRLKEDPYEKTTWISSPYQFVFEIGRASCRERV